MLQGETDRHYGGCLPGKTWNSRVNPVDLPELIVVKLVGNQWVIQWCVYHEQASCAVELMLSKKKNARYRFWTMEFKIDLPKLKRIPEGR